VNITERKRDRKREREGETGKEREREKLFDAHKVYSLFAHKW